MKILIVGFSESIHVARWINQLSDDGWEVCLFPSVDNGATNQELKNITVFHSFYGRLYNKNKKARIVGIPVLSHMVGIALRMILQKIVPDYHQRHLTRVIKRFKPDIIHSMEIQHAGYLVADVKKKWRGPFPKWIMTNWGSDIYLFGRFSEHKNKIRATLQSCDYYSCECKRDVALGQKFGFNKKVLPVFPNSSGFDLRKLKTIREHTKPSRRKVIVLKGYQGWAGRAMVALRAIDRCGKLLSDYKLVIYAIQPNTGVEIAAKLVAQKHKIKLQIVPLHTPHRQILKYHSQARVSIGLSISDAISTMVLEAMVMGSFPIQSNTSCADEWIVNNQTGMVVPPEDPEIVEKALREAITNDELVDNAARLNWKTALNSLDRKIIKQNIIKFYQEVYMKENKVFVTGIFGSGKTTFAKKYAKENRLKFLSFDRKFNYRSGKNQSHRLLQNLPEKFVMDAIPIDEKDSWGDFSKYEKSQHNIAIICVYCPDMNIWLKRVGKRAKNYNGLVDALKFRAKKILGRKTLPKNIEELNKEYRVFFTGTLPHFNKFKSVKYYDSIANEFTSQKEMLKKIHFDTFAFQEYLRNRPAGYDKYYQDIEAIGLIGYSESYKTWGAIKQLVAWKNKYVVDLGASHGYFSFKAEDCGAKVLGLEKSGSVVKTTKWINKLRGGKVIFKQWEGGKVIPKCDIILCLNVLHHFPDPDKVIKSMKSKKMIFEIKKQHQPLVEKYLKIKKTVPSQRTNRIILLCAPK